MTITEAPTTAPSADDPSVITAVYRAGYENGRAGAVELLDRTDITPCPVAWCDKFGKHPWTHDWDGARASRDHVHTPVPGVPGVTVGLWEAVDEPPQPAEVEIEDWKLNSSGEASEFVAAVQRAVTISFADDEQARARRDAQLEFDAAVREVAARSGTRSNEADGAAFRLRQAMDALDELSL